MVAGGEHCQLRAAIEVLVPYRPGHRGLGQRPSLLAGPGRHPSPCGAAARTSDSIAAGTARSTRRSIASRSPKVAESALAAPTWTLASQAAEVGGTNQVRQPIGILVTQRLLTRQHVGSRNLRICRSRSQLFEVCENVGLNFMFQLVRQFVTVSAEDLDAIVLPGIVRG